MFQVSINSIQKRLSYCHKQNFNLIVDAARHTDHRQSISRNFSLKNPAKRKEEEEVEWWIKKGGVIGLKKKEKHSLSLPPPQKNQWSCKVGEGCVW